MRRVDVFRSRKKVGTFPRNVRKADAPWARPYLGIGISLALLALASVRFASAQTVVPECRTDPTTVQKAAADVPSGGKPRFRKVFAFTDIGDDEHAAKLAELNVFAANCCDAGNRPDPEKLERAKRFGIVPYVAFGPFCGSHVQALSPEEARLQAELQGRFVPSEAKGDAGDRGRTDLWRTRHYRLGGEPEPGNTEVYVESIGCFVGTNACAKGAAGLVERLRANPEAKAVCLDYIGYANYRGCRHPDCLRLLEAWLEREGLADTEENRDRFFEDQIVAYYAALFDAVKAYDPSVVVYAHLYPVFLPDPLYGNRLKLDYCAQTCAWYFRWPTEKVRRYAETVVRGQRERWPFAHGVPFVAYGPWANGIDPDFGKTPEDLDRELRAVLESGAEYLSVHEIDSVIADPAVFAVFRKYCASPQPAFVAIRCRRQVWHSTPSRGRSVCAADNLPSPVAVVVGGMNAIVTPLDSFGNRGRSLTEIY